jgi:hypothetical protein
MGALIKYAAELYKNRGISAIFLFPQEGSQKLFNYYGQFGFKAVYQAKKIGAQSLQEDIDLTGFRLVNHEINNEEIFDGLYSAYVEFTARQSLAPMKNRLFYFKCASSYLDEPGRYFGVFERELYDGADNNVEKFCYVFYKKFENNYYIDDIIMTEYNKMRGNALNYSKITGLLADFILISGDDIKIEMTVLPESFDDNKLAMILALDEKVNDIADNLKSPVYLNMFMNI